MGNGCRRLETISELVREPLKLIGVRIVQHGKESAMRNRVLNSAALLTLLAIPLAACQSSGAATGAAGGAVAGAVVGGPVGAAVGGIAGAAAGGILTAEESTRVRTYVAAQRRPSIQVAEDVVVGQPLPPRVRVYPVPRNVGLQSSYSYTVVNDRTVLVDPQTREIVEVIE
jgi:hypothetical protein